VVLFGFHERTRLSRGKALNRVAGAARRRCTAARSASISGLRVVGPGGRLQHLGFSLRIAFGVETALGASIVVSASHLG